MLKRDEVNTLMFGHCVPEGNECVKSVKRIEEVNVRDFLSARVHFLSKIEELK